MIVTYHGAEFFKLQLGDTVIALNPISKDSKLKGARFGADVALISLNHADMNGTDVVTFGEKKPFIISSPGEYEVKDIFVRGFKSDSKYGGSDRINTIYSFNFDGINICYLGALGDGGLPAEADEAIDEVDILFVPIGGQGVLSAAAAAKLAVKIEPKLIIPMHYGDVGDDGALKQFLKESGEGNVAPVDKLTLERKGLDGKQGDVVVLDIAS